MYACPTFFAVSLHLPLHCLKGSAAEGAQARYKLLAEGFYRMLGEVMTLFARTT